MMSSDGGGQPADSGGSSPRPFNPSQGLLGGLAQGGAVSHDASLHVLSASVAWHHIGAAD